ncbi:MAG: Nif11-like leader peptide family natural product precursor [Candidatus Eremiobacterota bacterium]
MSFKSAHAFLERFERDREFKEKLERAKDKDELLKLIKEAGFNFTSEDVKEATKELSEEELQNIEGGSLMNFLFNTGISLTGYNIPC